ncbi:MAG: tetratricopeptide repeat protein [SAR324 cluster bacterium]|nr:tetratricopeptide repeat protein [SAR324 cluster bacterium]
MLPFVNMSGDPEQEYFSDGISEDITTDLSRMPRLFVIARNSSFQYKGRHVDVRKIGEELGVKYILEGSVRKAGERVRITAQLVQAKTGEQLWAHRYDREMQDIFALQDEITRNIAAELEIKLVEGEQARGWQRSTSNLEAYDLALRGRDLTIRMTMEDRIRGRHLVEKALELDPKFAYATVLLGRTYVTEAVSGRSETPDKSLDRAIKLGNQALVLDETLSEAHGLLCQTFRYKGEHDRAVEHGQRALALNPDDADSTTNFASVLARVGRGVEALDRMETALRLNPFPPYFYLRVLGIVYRSLGRFEEAIEVYRKCVEHLPDYFVAQIGLTLAYMDAEREEEGRAQAHHILRINPSFSSSSNPYLVQYKDLVQREQFVTLLRKAGLPE